MNSYSYLRLLDQFVENNYGAALYDCQHFDSCTFRYSMLQSLGYLRRPVVEPAQGPCAETELNAKDLHQFRKKGYLPPESICTDDDRDQLSKIAFSAISQLRNGDPVPRKYSQSLRNIFLDYLKRTGKSSFISNYIQSKYYFVEGPIFLYSSSEKDIALDTKQLSDKAYLFHRDIYSTMSIKVFIRLHESASSGGNHVFVEGSHNFCRDLHLENTTFTKRGAFSEAFNVQSLVDTYQDGRFSTNSIARLFGNNLIKEFLPQFGQCWFEDTFGLHKGTSLRFGERLYGQFILSKAKLK